MYCEKLRIKERLHVSLPWTTMISQLVFIGEVFHSSYHFCGSPLDPLQQIHVFSLLRNPELDAALQANSPSLITGWLEEEADPPLAATSFQVVAECDRVSIEPSFSRLNTLQLSQLLLTGLVLQTLHQLYYPSLATLQNLNVFLAVRGPFNIFLAVRGPKLNMGFSAENRGMTTALVLQPTLSDTGQNGHTVFSCSATADQHSHDFWQLFSQPVVLPGVVVTKVQDLTLGPVELYTVGLSPKIQPVQSSLSSLFKSAEPSCPPVDHSHSTWHHLQTHGALNPLVQIISEYIMRFTTELSMWVQALILK
ncbi:hypothetical protein WISP_22618 [Willisornis vidua]|uniref:Uncharacterized protein n=1 Tax=Willisornis vidua TaxID=1566151 RepID=A0ABQ9DS77_9PASS|nr:hypothetical protein WISP_22618 [Willisornis vidua]